MRSSARNASTHRAGSTDSSHKLASCDELRTANVASYAALDPRKAVLPRSILSFSTFRASRTIEHRERRSHGGNSFTMGGCMVFLVPPLDINLPRCWCKTRDIQSAQDNDGAVRKSPILQSVLILVRQSEQVSSRTRRGARQRETGSPHRLRAYGVQACSANPLAASQRGWARKRCTSRAPAANVTRNDERDQRRAATYRHHHSQ